MAENDLIHFVFWVQLDTRQVPPCPNPTHPGLPQEPVRGCGGQQ